MDEQLKMIIVIVASMSLLAITCTCIQTKIEQDTFNKLSHTKVTFTEALFTNLRIMPD